VTRDIHNNNRMFGKETVAEHRRCVTNCIDRLRNTLNEHFTDYFNEVPLNCKCERLKKTMKNNKLK
jgi:hypothetical protein